MKVLKKKQWWPVVRKWLEGKGLLEEKWDVYENEQREMGGRGAKVLLRRIELVLGVGLDRESARGG